MAGGVLTEWVRMTQVVPLPIPDALDRSVPSHNASTLNPMHSHTSMRTNVHSIHLPANQRQIIDSLIKYVGFASFVVLIWDHIDTFADEVEYAWKERKGLCMLFHLQFSFTHDP